MADHVLVSTLGRVPKEQGGAYRRVRYRFPDGLERESSLFGLALLDWLTRQDPAPTRLVLLGTRSSMWDALIEQWQSSSQWSGDDEGLYVRLGDLLAQSRPVEDEGLDELSRLATERLSCQVLCRPIGFCLEADEQSQLLAALAEEIPAGSSVSLDVTHGLRHLPMLSLISAFHLRQAKQAHVAGVYYGALEARGDDGVAPVARLDFVLDAVRWIESVAAMRHSTSLAALEDAPGVPGVIRQRLRAVSFYEGTNQVVAARREAKAATAALRAAREAGQLSPSARLYEPLVTQSLDWAEKSRYGQRQYGLAVRAFERDDLVRCTVLLHEALVSSQVGSHEDVLNHHIREEALARLAAVAGDELRTIRYLRNAIVHGNRPPRREEQQLLADETRFRDSLRRLLDWVGQQLGMD